MVSINFHLQKQDTSQIWLMGHRLLSPNLDESYKEIVLKDEARRTGGAHMGDFILIFIKMRNPSQDKEQVGIILYLKNNGETVTKVQIREPENVGLENISVYFASGSIEIMYVNRPDLLSVTTFSISPHLSVHQCIYTYLYPTSHFSVTVYCVFPAMKTVVYPSLPCATMLSWTTGSLHWLTCGIPLCPTLVSQSLQQSAHFFRRPHNQIDKIMIQRAQLLLTPSFSFHASTLSTLASAQILPQSFSG